VSYEGRRQLLCARGHYEVADAYDPDGCIGGPCTYRGCNETFVWANEVDDTNCDGVCVELKVKTPALICTCSNCGDKHVIEEATYEIPNR